MDAGKVSVCNEKVQKICHLLKQKTTWVGIFLLAGLAGVNIPEDLRTTLGDPETWVAIGQAVAGLAGVLLILFDEKKANGQ